MLYTNFHKDWPTGSDFMVIELRMLDNWYMSLCVRKPTICVSDQIGHKPACTVIEAGKKLETLYLRRGIVLCSENKGADQLRSVTAKLVCAFVFAL